MVVVLEQNITSRDKESLRAFLLERGFQVREVVGESETIFGAVGSSGVDHREVEMLAGVARVVPISKPYKLASREFKKEDTVFPVGPIKIGGNRVVVIAGPCAVEGRDEILECARIVAAAGGVMLRGGAYKPRTSPYSFQGLGEEGLRYLKDAGERYGLPVVSEIVSPAHADTMLDYVDVFQIGARNMQNFELLKTVGALVRPVMLKRGLCATIEEWLMAAEYLLAHGAEDVILCERGIRTFETYTRNSLDISSIPVVKKLSHLPVLVDPSHATGLRDQVIPVGLAGIAAGADGLIVEVHPDPPHAASDGPQTLFPEQFEKLMRDITALSPVVGREVARLPAKKRAAPVTLNSGADGGQAGSGQDGGQDSGQGSGQDSEIAVAFQGARGAYSEIALGRFFESHPGGVSALPNTAFRNVFEAVLDGTAEYGIVPLENSLMGSIHQNYDLLLAYPDVEIVGETHIRIEHSLIGTPDSTIETIREVISQGPGIEQCRDFLDTYPHWTITPFYDTAGAVARIQEAGDASLAAIANSRTAGVYGMKVLKQGIESNPRNYTRFAILSRDGRRPDPLQEATMAALVFSTPDTPGALFECMRVLAERKLNLKKLESRPILGQPWQYRFYADVQMPASEQEFSLALRELEGLTRDLRVLGRYRGSRGPVSA